MLEEAVYQPQQNLDVAAGRAVFEASCASCHRFGAVGTDHGVAGLDLTASPLRAAKYSLLEAVMMPNRTVAAVHETSVLKLTDGGTTRGLVVRETAQAVTLLTPDGKTVDVPAAQIASRTKEKTSLMTDALADGIGQTQLRNLAAFLTGPGQQ
jgi:putative heme-binding domain-containing protein